MFNLSMNSAHKGPRDTRSRWERRGLLDLYWDSQIEMLADEYLRWSAGISAPLNEVSETVSSTCFFVDLIGTDGTYI